MTKAINQIFFIPNIEPLTISIYLISLYETDKGAGERRNEILIKIPPVPNVHMKEGMRNLV